jgi:hypothetical protein
MVLDREKPCTGSIRGLNIAAIRPITELPGTTRMQQWDKEPTLTGFAICIRLSTFHI